MLGHPTSLSLLAHVVVRAGTVPIDHAVLDESESIELLEALRRAGANPKQSAQTSQGNSYPLPELLMVTLPHKIEGFDASGIMAWLVDNGADPTSALERSYGTPPRSLQTFLDDMIQPGLIDYLQTLQVPRGPKP